MLSNSVCNHACDKQIWLAARSSNFGITHTLTDWIGLCSVIIILLIGWTGRIPAASTSSNIGSATTTTTTTTNTTAQYISCITSSNTIESIASHHFFAHIISAEHLSKELHRVIFAKRERGREGLGRLRDQQDRGRGLLQAWEEWVGGVWTLTLSFPRSHL